MPQFKFPMPFSKRKKAKNEEKPPQFKFDGDDVARSLPPGQRYVPVNLAHSEYINEAPADVYRTSSSSLPSIHSAHPNPNSWHLSLNVAGSYPRDDLRKAASCGPGHPSPNHHQPDLRHNQSVGNVQRAYPTPMSPKQQALLSARISNGQETASPYANPLPAAPQNTNIHGPNGGTNFYPNPTNQYHNTNQSAPHCNYVASAGNRKPVQMSPKQIQLLEKSLLRGAPASAPNPSPMRTHSENPAPTRQRSLLSPLIPEFVPQATTDYGSPLRRRKALLIGIGYRNHKHLMQLPGCTNDVCSMFQLLTSDLFNFPQHSISVLSDELSSIGDVPVEAPTRWNILKGMSWLTEDIHPGDSAVFFFAGHGDRIVDISGDEIESGFDQCIIPVDFLKQPMEPVKKHPSSAQFRGTVPILDDTIYERLVRSVPPGAKVTAIVDACRSGSVCDLPVVYENGQPRPRFQSLKYRPPQRSLRPDLSAGGFVLFSGSADHQLSVDMTLQREEGRESFGIMTKSFVDAVTEMAADRVHGPSGFESWSYGMLFERVKFLVKERSREALPDERLPANVERQVPQLSSSHPFDIAKTPFAM